MRRASGSIIVAVVAPWEGAKVEVKPAHSEPIEPLQHRVGDGRVNHRDRACVATERRQRVEQTAIIGAICGGLDEHLPPDAESVHQRAIIVRCRIIGTLVVSENAG
jgi:hypothetical protein